ncbi:hypothetical protein Pla163_10150 [Planctomycetes bacterium Pla163]|uniref:HutD n=1 Tax=Rohdeia mirabilis TaxID=2528008 RepID=A0A518CXG9_9BACT|nr:hypothetical protein Pla163_10150 [Planctomycetes bacterium Pla163]
MAEIWTISAEGEETGQLARWPEGEREPLLWGLEFVDGSAAGDLDEGEQYSGAEALDRLGVALEADSRLRAGDGRTRTLRPYEVVLARAAQNERWTFRGPAFRACYDAERFSARADVLTLGHRQWRETFERGVDALIVAARGSLSVRVSDEEEGETLGPHDALWIHDAAGGCEADLVGADPDAIALVFVFEALTSR